MEESRAKESRRVMQKMRDQIKDEELKHMMDADDYDDNDSDQKINQKFKGAYGGNNNDVSDSADVSMEEGGNEQQELDDDEDSQDLDENLMDDDDAKDFWEDCGRGLIFEKYFFRVNRII